MTPSPGWDRATLGARISDERRRWRHPAGSPDEAEVAAYATALPAGTEGTVVVLGMTPELRALAAGYPGRTLAIDISQDAIALYGDWLAPRDRARETIVQADWRQLGELVDEPVAAVIGDGVFGNLSDERAHREMLRLIASTLRPEGRFVTRHAVIPRGFRPAEHRADVLLARFRAGELDEAEFGFGTRLLGHYHCCYDPATGRLDNAKLFAEVDAARDRGELGSGEHAAIARYRFSSDNCILDQDRWEALLVEAGFAFSTAPLGRRSWYSYYPVYACRPSETCRRESSGLRRLRGASAPRPATAAS